MRILVRGGDDHINLILPTRMLFSRAVMGLLKFSLKFQKEDILQGIPPEALDAIFAEIRRIKKKHGSWELVNVESSNGETVKIIL